MKKFFHLSVYVLLVVSIALIGLEAAVDGQLFAQDQQKIIENLERNSGDGFGLPKNEPTDANIRRVLQTVFLAAGALSVIFTAVGGLRYVLSEGNEQKIKQAKDTITYAIVGLIVSMSAYAIVSFILRGIIQ